MHFHLATTAQQSEIILDTSRIKVLMCGRRWGKSALVSFALIKYGLEHTKHNILCVTKTYSQVLEIYNAILADPAYKYIFRRKYYRVGAPKLEFITGSTVTFHSFERPQNLRGKKAHLLIVDECQLLEKNQLDSVLMPLVADTRGSIYFCGTPTIQDHWFYEYFQKGQKDATGRFKSWRFTTLDGPMFQTQEGRDEIERQRECMAKSDFAREYLAEPSGAEGGVFTSSEVDSIITKGISPPPQGSQYAYHAGLDIGRMRDPSALVILDNLGQVHHSEILPLGMMHEHQAALVAERLKAYPNCRVMMDSTSGGMPGSTAYVQDQTIQVFREFIPNVQELIFTHNKKHHMVQALRYAVEKLRVAIPDSHKDLLTQMRQFTFSIKGGYYYYGSPKIKDDLVCALLMAVWDLKLSKGREGLSNIRGVLRG